MPMQVHLRDRTVLLVGDGQDVGAALAQALESSGARVARNAAPGEANLLVVLGLDGSLPLQQVTDACRTAADTMDDSGRILIVASVTGLVPMRGDGSAPAQAALLALARGLALDLAPRGIKVNALAVPAGPQAAARMRSHIPGGVAPDARAIAEAALFLLDPDNTYTTGHVLVADGGWTVGYGRDF